MPWAARPELNYRMGMELKLTDKPPDSWRQGREHADTVRKFYLGVSTSKNRQEEPSWPSVQPWPMKTRSRRVSRSDGRDARTRRRAVRRTLSLDPPLEFG